MNEDIEDLFRQGRTEPRAELRERVLAAVQVELQSELRGRPDSLPASGVRWRSLAALAALVTLWMHVAWSAALHVRLELPADSHGELAQSAAQLRELLPDLSGAESRSMALRLHLGASAPRHGGPTRPLTR